MTLNGLVQGCIPIMSYNYGAKNEKRLTQAFQYGNTIGILLTGVSIIILCLFPSQVLTAFNASEEMLSFGVPALRIMCISYVFAAIAIVDTGYVAVVKIYGHDRDLVRIYSRRGHHSCNQLGFI